MAISTVRRLAADIFGVGERKIRFAPESIKEIEGAMTRDDVRGLIEKGLVKKLPVKGRASSKRTVRRGPGHRRGPLFDSKDVWMQKVRSQRAFLKMLIASGALKKETKRGLYGKIKSGILRNKKAFLLYLKENKMIAESYEPPKIERRRPEQKAPAQKQTKPGVSSQASQSKPQAFAQKTQPQTGAQKTQPQQAQPSANRAPQQNPQQRPVQQQQKPATDAPAEKRHEQRKGES